MIPNNIEKNAINQEEVVFWGFYNLEGVGMCVISFTVMMQWDFHFKLGFKWIWEVSWKQTFSLGAMSVCFSLFLIK